MPKIIQVKDLKNIKKFSDLCHKSKEPIFIVKDDSFDLVIMSMETYEKKIALLDVYQKLQEAEIDLEAGAVVDAEEVFEAIRQEYGK